MCSKSGEWGPIWYIAEEYCAGKSLADWLDDYRGGVSLRVAIDLVATLAAAVDYAHNHGVIHRDLKPSNVILDARCATESAGLRKIDGLDFVPKLVDFGLAKLLEGAPDETRSSAILGTPAYMAPEQAEGRMGEVGPRTDVYGLGMILYELLTGRPPYSGATDVETLRRIVTDDPVPPRKLRADIPRDLEAICLKCIEKDPARRYPSAAALGDDLARFRAGEPTVARPLGPSGRMWRLISRRPAAAALCAVVLIAGMAGLTGFWWYSASLRNVQASNDRFRVSAGAQKALALREEMRAHRYAYVADIGTAFAAWQHNPQAVALLARHRPAKGEEDYRSFVWYFLWRHCRSQLHTLEAAGGEADLLACSFNSNRLASADRKGTVRLWDVEKERELTTLTQNHGIVNALALSDDGRLLAVAGNDSSILLWDVTASQARTRLAGRSSRVRSLAFSADAKTLAVGSDDQFITLYDATTGKIRASLEGRTGGVRVLAFSPDGMRLATGTDQGLMQVWNTATSELLLRMSGQQTNKLVGCLKFSHDGKSLASASGGEDARVKVWDALSGTRKKLFTGHSGIVRALAFTADDRTLSVAVADGSVWQWSVASGKLVDKVRGHAIRVRHSEFSPDGHLLATTGGDGTIQIWDVNADQLHTTIPNLAACPDCLALSADGMQVAAALSDPQENRLSLEAWNTRPGALEGSALNSRRGLGPISFSDGRCIVGQALNPPNRVAVWLVSNLDGRWIERTFRFNPGNDESSSTLTALAVSQDGRWLATGHPRGTLKFWRLPEGQLRTTVALREDDRIALIHFSPDGRFVASATQGGTIRLYDVETGRSRGMLVGPEAPPLAMAFSPDGSWLATASSDQMVKVWKAATGLQFSTLHVHSNNVRALAFSPDGRTLAGGGDDGTIEFWDVATFRELISLEAHAGGVKFLAFSDDGHKLASCGASANGRGEIFLWNATSGNE